MQVSAEIRWFWRSSGPPLLREWFMDTGFHQPAAGRGGPTNICAIHSKQNLASSEEATHLDRRRLGSGLMIGSSREDSLGRHG